MAIDRVTATVPLLHTQLGFPVSGTTDCAVRTAQSAIEYGTWGQESPAPPELRPLMGAKTKGGTSMPQALRGIRTFGIEPIKIGPRNRGPIARIEEWLTAGHFVAVYGNYGAVIDGWRPLAGSKTYRGGHAIGIYGIEAGQTLSFDPLYDGRRANIPRGPTMVPLGMIRAFTESMAGTGQASAYAVPLDAVRVEAQADLKDATTELEQVKKALLDVAGQLTAAQAALAECQAKPPADCSECEMALAEANAKITAAKEALG
jgi:hypothetical protein